MNKISQGLMDQVASRWKEIPASPSFFVPFLAKIVEPPSIPVTPAVRMKAETDKVAMVEGRLAEARRVGCVPVELEMFGMGSDRKKRSGGLCRWSLIRPQLVLPAGPTPLCLFPSPDRCGIVRSARNLYEDSMRFVRRMDELGFDGVLFTEHHYSPNGGLTPSPLVLLAGASQVTERIKLITMGIHSRSIHNRCGSRRAGYGRQPVRWPGCGWIRQHHCRQSYAYNVTATEDRARLLTRLTILLSKAWTESEPFECMATTSITHACRSCLGRSRSRSAGLDGGRDAESLQLAAQRHMPS